MKYERSSGIILHPTSLPGPDGIGDFGPDAYQWLNFLAESRCNLWQVLPLGPTGYGDSPYQTFSAFAGNPYLISPTLLLEQGLLTYKDLSDRPSFNPELINFGEVIKWKLTILDRAFRNFQNQNSSLLNQSLKEFHISQQHWLDDFCLFMAIKESLGGNSWSTWPKPFRLRQPGALNEFRKNHEEEIDRQVFRQFIFFRQWNNLKDYANKKGIYIVGDVPIFIAHDSADAWSHSELFFFNKDRQPTVVAGVPPDYFSPTGQLWGNPLYRWDIHNQTGFQWWKDRIQAALSLFDFIRLDHFRGFAGYWEVQAGMPTAEKGRWVPGPGEDFFNSILSTFNDLPMIAEDLGEITPDVIKLRDQYNLPGMKILQFAFSSTPSDPFLPHNYPTNCVAYTGTHDNDTSCGWYESASEKERDFIRRYLECSGRDISWDMVRSIWSSVAVFALAPLQDFLSLGNFARLNFPGKPSGNWGWRFLPASLSQDLNDRLKELNFLYNRGGFIHHEESLAVQD